VHPGIIQTEVSKKCIHKTATVGLAIEINQVWSPKLCPIHQIQRSGIEWEVSYHTRVCWYRTNSIMDSVEHQPSCRGSATWHRAEPSLSPDHTISTSPRRTSPSPDIITNVFISSIPAITSRLSHRGGECRPTQRAHHRRRLCWTVSHFALLHFIYIYLTRNASQSTNWQSSHYHRLQFTRKTRLFPFPICFSSH
jgi:hypothetical protein